MENSTAGGIKPGIMTGDLVGHVTRQFGTGGSGAPHLAFGGGRDAAKIPAALVSFSAWVVGKLK